MLFQIRIQCRVPVRRKRASPVHGLFTVHLGRHVVIQDFRRLTTRNELELTIERSTARPDSRHHFGPPFNLALIFTRSRHTPQTAYRLESAEHIGFIPLDRFNFIQGLRKRFIASLRIENLRKRFPRNRSYTSNSLRFVFRNRIEHREREFRKLGIRHFARVIFRFFIHTRHANRIREICRKIESRKSRLINDTNLLILIEHAHFKHSNRSRINRNMNDRSHRFIGLHGRIDRRSCTRCSKEHTRRKPCKAQKRSRYFFHFHKRNNNKMVCRRGCIFSKLYS